MVNIQRACPFTKELPVHRNDMSELAREIAIRSVSLWWSVQQLRIWTVRVQIFNTEHVLGVWSVTVEVFYPYFYYGQNPSQTRSVINNRVIQSSRWMGVGIYRVVGLCRTRTLFRVEHNVPSFSCLCHQAGIFFIWGRLRSKPGRGYIFTSAT